jgi:hypothetical protein
MRSGSMDAIRRRNGRVGLRSAPSSNSEAIDAYAARTVARKFSTSVFSVLLSLTSEDASV